MKCEGKKNCWLLKIRFIFENLFTIILHNGEKNSYGDSIRTPFECAYCWILNDPQK